MIAIVGLAQDDEGIPDNSDWMAAIAYIIIKRAEALCVRLQGIVIDCITLALRYNVLTSSCCRRRG
jgi:hypothetical protein